MSLSKRLINTGGESLAACDDFDTSNLTIVSTELFSNGSYAWLVMIRFFDNGTKMVFNKGTTLYQCDLTIPYQAGPSSRVNTVSITGLSNQNVTYGNFYDNGYKFILSIQTGEVVQLNLNVPYDATSFSSKDTITTYPIFSHSFNAFDFNADGSKIIIANATSNVKEYSLSTPYDMTSTFTSTGVTVTFNAFNYLEYNSDGTKLMTSDNTFDNLRVYDLSTPYDITTNTLVNSVNIDDRIYHGTWLDVKTVTRAECFLGAVYLVGNSYNGAYRLREML